MTKQTETYSEKETFEYARALAEQAVPGQVYCLNGELGVGKTVFAQGFGKGLGIDEPIVSPTFTILKEYDEGRLPLYHFDVYRVSDPDELFEIGFDEYLHAGGVCLIEWADLIEDILPDNTVWIKLDYAEGEDERVCVIETDQFSEF